MQLSPMLKVLQLKCELTHNHQSFSNNICAVAIVQDKLQLKTCVHDYCMIFNYLRQSVVELPITVSKSVVREKNLLKKVKLRYCSVLSYSIYLYSSMYLPVRPLCS